MHSPYSPHVHRFLRGPVTDRSLLHRFELGVVVEPVNDPLEELELIQSALSGEDVDLQKRRAYRRRNEALVSFHSSGLLNLDGRLCCGEMIQRWEAKIHLQLARLPLETTCPACGATYRLTLGVRHAE